ncbi:MAG: hypothetical protein ACJAVR_003391 [Paracoccaceae bacterium]|jgi:hypothetical protein
MIQRPVAAACRREKPVQTVGPPDITRSTSSNIFKDMGEPAHVLPTRLPNRPLAGESRCLRLDAPGRSGGRVGRKARCSAASSCKITGQLMSPQPSPTSAIF